MGIDGFGCFLRKTCPTVFRTCAPNAFEDKRLALDMHLLVYQMFYRNGGSTAHTLDDVRRFATRLKTDRITATFVFDGNTYGLKPRAHKSRKESHEKSVATLHSLSLARLAVTERLQRAYHTLAAEDEVVATAVTTAECEDSIEKREGDAAEPLPDDGHATAGDSACVKAESPQPTEITVVVADDDIKSLLEMDKKLDAEVAAASTRVLKPSLELFRSVKSILSEEFGAEGIVVAEDDGERHVALLAATGAVDYAVSGDYDTLIFGSPNLVVNFLHPSTCCVVALQDIIAGLKLENLAQLRDFCILCGCDFCDKVPGIGPVTALRHLQKYGSIDKMFDVVLRPRLVKANVTTFDYVFARERFCKNDKI
jgi:5'-3' exonuclease